METSSSDIHSEDSAERQTSINCPEEETSIESTPTILTVANKNDDDIHFESTGNHESSIVILTADSNGNNGIDGQDINNESSMNITSISENEKRQIPEAEKTKWLSEEINYGSYTEESFQNWLKEDYRTKHGIWYVKSLEEVNEIISNYQYKTMTKYCTYFASKNFGHANVYEKSHKIRWAGEDMTFDGIPYIMCCVKRMDCQFGKVRRSKDTNRKRSHKLIDSKKCGCEAFIRIKEAVKFPEFKLLRNTGWQKTKNSKSLRGLMSCREIVKMEKVFILFLPSAMDHCQHTIGEDQELLKDKVHCDIIMQIQKLYLTHHSICQIQSIIKNYVQNEMPNIASGPDAKKRRYNPEKNDISNVCHHLRKLCRLDERLVTRMTKIMEELELSPLSVFHVSEFKVKLKQSEQSSDEERIENVETFSRKKIRCIETFLLVVQTKFQQRLMQKYNHILYVIEINHDTVYRKVIPWEMYLIVVQTCCDYQVVCTVVCSRERKDALTEVFQMIKEVFGASLPKYFFLDCSSKLCEAFELVFPEIPYYFLDESCQKYWEMFLNRPSNELLSQKDEVVCHLNDIRNSYTEEGLNLSAALFEASDVWKSNEKLQTWFQKNWLGSAKRWVIGYIHEDVHIMHHFTDSITKASKLYSNEMAILYQAPNNLQQLLENICQKLPEFGMKRHIQNVNAAYVECCKSNEDIKSFPHLCSIPELIKPFTVPLLNSSSTKRFKINEEGFGTFIVVKELESHQEGNNVENTNNRDCVGEEINLRKVITSYGMVDYSLFDSEDTHYTVTFGSNLTFPLCTCKYWVQYKLPCVHMCAVFIQKREWGYDMLSTSYRTNSSFNIDYSYLQEKELNMNTEKQIEIQNKEDFSEVTDNLNMHLQNYLEKLQNDETFSYHNVDKIEKNITSLLEIMKEKWRERFKSINQLKYISKSCQMDNKGPAKTKVINPLIRSNVQENILKTLEFKNNPLKLVMDKTPVAVESNIKNIRLVPPIFPTEEVLLKHPLCANTLKPNSSSVPNVKGRLVYLNMRTDTEIPIFLTNDDK